MGTNARGLARRACAGGLLSAALLLAALAGGCGAARAPADPYGALRSPGPPPSARPGAQVWAAGMPLLVAASADGGATWRTRHVAAAGDPFTEVLFGIAFADARHGWAVGKGGVILATADGGAAWPVQHAAEAGTDLLDVATTDAHHAWAVGFAAGRTAGLVLATTDGGRTWRRRYGGSDLLSAVSFPDALHGWAVGSTGILATADGGLHWRLQRTVPATYHLSGVTFSDARHGWAVGGAGAALIKPGFVMATSDGGAHWTLQIAGTRDSLNDVSFVDARRGWVAGSQGLLYRTTDGGATWTEVAMNRAWEFGAVTFADARHGWMVVHPHWDVRAAAAGDTGAAWGLQRQLVLLATSDGGQTWTAVTCARDLHTPVIVTDVACREAAAQP